MNKNNLSGQFNEVKDKIENNLGQAKNSSKKSFNDWYEYIESHPFQSMLFGTVIYFALKGFLRGKS